MPPFRNLFPRRPPAVNVEEAPGEPGQLSAERSPARSPRPSLTLQRPKVDEPHEYKMSVVNDNGVYLPPSPTETKSYWQRPSSRKASRNLVDENEPFSISRESFDSYRRSFDISARSPVSQHSDIAASRTSLDSRLSRTTCPRSSINGYSLEPPIDSNGVDEVEDPFEDVSLADDSKPKKRGLFSRFGDSPASQQTPGKHSFHFPGRRRDQSGQGAELASIDRAK
ncbi:hypothetical protein H112_03914 [Trichophyton rubrum D6]|uniref:Uncharacterized protein n=4 Tax=Trichophyton TaxID=5550 RepID=A0A178F065_TRIRU|nr:uncharacterized protein TERG_05244 [Trichophyton rubrum CBS 118892]EZF23471.1 hypothetical protein H100_03922 [Trichophyton rubrum MR850]EZF42629.1 hypothetical protein H102_03909 [Trichophyton rubrum CBS 100081]EZF53245.1 hypothetical protein H103_03923 [Trichophyton rubrum CBS 288.86]EZF63728.1 hypothetical protein H104_03908 [Trichophyton rubrum CBS 289.86]EZF74234.1 hypothetical protein H105_03937 [Trichophyton soudanense CBS 452.61]EZF85193.1 hypothetical protein H110_03915 [Trichophy